jgi:hypothetical protein
MTCCLDWWNPESVTFAEHLPCTDCVRVEGYAIPSQQAVPDGRVVRLGSIGRWSARITALFEVQRGETLGSSGAGKSMLMRCLSGLKKPGRARVKILGHDIVPLAEHALAGAPADRHDLPALQSDVGKDGTPTVGGYNPANSGVDK